VGDTVNVASRVADLCKKFDTDILISHQTYQHLTQDYGLISLPSTRVKGRSENLMVYRAPRVNPRRDAKLLSK
jgi:adenylate cyclase